MAVLRGGRRHERGVPRARPARRRRQRELLQRVARQRHRPHAGRRGGRCGARAHRRRRPRPRWSTATTSWCSAPPPPSSAGRNGPRVTDCCDGAPPAADLAARRRAARAGARPRAAAHRQRGARLLRRRARGGSGRDGHRRRGGRTLTSPGADARARARVVLGVGVAGGGVGGAGREIGVVAAALNAGVPAAILGRAGGDRIEADGAFSVSSRTPPRPGATPFPTSSAPLPRPHDGERAVARSGYPGSQRAGPSRRPAPGAGYGILGHVISPDPERKPGHACGVFGVYAPGQRGRQPHVPRALRARSTAARSRPASR